MTAIGADCVIDYTKKDFTSDRDRYFSVFDAVGKESFAHCRDLIEPADRRLGVALDARACEADQAQITRLGSVIRLS